MCVTIARGAILYVAIFFSAAALALSLAGIINNAWFMSESTSPAGIRTTSNVGLWEVCTRIKVLATGAHSESCTKVADISGCDAIEQRLKAAEAAALIYIIFVGIEFFALIAAAASGKSTNMIVNVVFLFMIFSWGLICWAIMIALFKNGYCGGRSFDDNGADLSFAFPTFFVGWVCAWLAAILHIVASRAVTETVVVTTTTTTTNAPHA